MTTYYFGSPSCPESQMSDRIQSNVETQPTVGWKCIYTLTDSNMHYRLPCWIYGLPICQNIQAMDIGYIWAILIYSITQYSIACPPDSNKQWILYLSGLHIFNGPSAWQEHTSNEYWVYIDHSDAFRYLIFNIHRINIRSVIRLPPANTESISGQ